MLLLFSCSMVNGSVDVAFLKRFSTSCIIVWFSLYIIKMSSTYRNYPRMLCWISMFGSTVCSRNCRYISERIDDIGAPIARPVFCIKKES